MSKNTDRIEKVLEAAGYEDYGGGNNFTDFGHKTKPHVYVFESAPGSGPDDSHWVAVSSTDPDVILAGGFTAAVLGAWLADVNEVA